MGTDPIRISVAVILDSQDRALLVRKRDTDVFIQPGGKAEPGENSLDALRRELQEELGAQLVCADFVGTFEDRAVNEPGRRVIAEAFVVEVEGALMPNGEIEELLWVHIEEIPLRSVAPLTVNGIFPALRRRAAAMRRLAGSAVSGNLVRSNQLFT